MAIVGPRPEAPDIVEKYYDENCHKSLRVRPGLTSPGSIYYYTHGEQVLAEGSGDAEQVYADLLLPKKMAVDLDYLDHATVLTDLVVILQTASVLLQKALGRTKFTEPRSVCQMPVTDNCVSNDSRAA